MTGVSQESVEFEIFALAMQCRDLDSELRALTASIEDITESRKDYARRIILAARVGDEDLEARLRFSLEFLTGAELHLRDQHATGVRRRETRLDRLRGLRAPLESREPRHDRP